MEFWTIFENYLLWQLGPVNLGLQIQSYPLYRVLHKPSFKQGFGKQCVFGAKFVDNIK